MNDLQELIAAVWQQIERIDRLRINAANVSTGRKKMPGITPHSGVYRMSLDARDRASEMQKKRWSEFLQAKETEIENKTKAPYNRQ